MKIQETALSAFALLSIAGALPVFPQGTLAVCVLFSCSADVAQIKTSNTTAQF